MLQGFVLKVCSDDDDVGMDKFVGNNVFAIFVSFLSFLLLLCCVQLFSSHRLMWLIQICELINFRETNKTNKKVSDNIVAEEIKRENIKYRPGLLLQVIQPQSLTPMAITTIF